ncbi:MAG: sigma-70 family RNA polymerase sigma factor [Myxococcota bacterium]
MAYVRPERLAEIEEAVAAAGFHVKMAEGYEEDLVQRLKKQDEEAFNELVRLYQGRIFRLVFRMLGNREEAEDLAQEVFVTVFTRIESFRGDSKLSTWLYRVATNHCKNRIKYLGRRARGKKKELDEIADASAIESATMSTSAQLPRPDEALAGRQIESFVQQALVALSDEQRELVVLRDIENMTYEELQTVTGLAAGTVKSRLHRARLALAQKVRELQNEAKP